MSFIIKTKILQLFICYKTSVLKVPKYFVTGSCKVLYQLVIEVNFFENIFITQLLFSFHEIVVLVPNYHARSFVCFFYNKDFDHWLECMAFHSSPIKLEYVFCFLLLLHNSFSSLLKNILRAGWPLGSLHYNLDLKHGTSLNCGVCSFRKYHLFLIR